MVTGLIIHLLPFPKFSLHPPLSWPHRLHHLVSIDSGFWLDWANVRQFKRAKSRGKGSIGEFSLPTAPSASARLFCSWLHPSRTISPPRWTPIDSVSSSRLQVHAPSLLRSVPQVLSLGASALPAGFLSHPRASVKSPFCSVSPESLQNMPFVLCGPWPLQWEPLQPGADCQERIEHLPGRCSHCGFVILTEVSWIPRIASTPVRVVQK